MTAPVKVSYISPSKTQYLLLFILLDVLYKPKLMFFLLFFITEDTIEFAGMSQDSFELFGHLLRETALDLKKALKG